MIKAWKIIKAILNNIFRILVSLFIVVIFVGLSPIIAVFLVSGWLHDNWGLLGMVDILKIGANHENKESDSDEND